MSNIILVDTRHFGFALYRARKQARLGREICANILGITFRDLRRIESGRDCISPDLMQKIMFSGLMLMRTNTQH